MPTLLESFIVIFMDDTQVVDAEVVEEGTEDAVSQDGFQSLDDLKVSPVTNSPEDQSQLLTSLDEMIKSHVQSIDRLRTEVKKLREMIQDGFANDAVYKEHDDAAKAAAKVRQATKAQIMKQPAIVALVNKMKTLNGELKEKQFSLSDYLLEYQRLSGANQIETDDGQVLEIVNSAKVIRKTK